MYQGRHFCTLFFFLLNTRTTCKQQSVADTHTHAHTQHTFSCYTRLIHPRNSDRHFFFIITGLRATDKHRNPLTWSTRVIMASDLKIHIHTIHHTNTHTLYIIHKKHFITAEPKIKYTPNMLSWNIPEAMIILEISSLKWALRDDTNLIHRYGMVYRTSGGKNEFTIRSYIKRQSKHWF